MVGHRTAERRSVAYHAAIADRLGAEPDLVSRANARLTAWESTKAVHSHWIDRWRSLLALPTHELQVALRSTADDMVALRQVTPFAGSLDARTRWRIWRATREAA